MKQHIFYIIFPFISVNSSSQDSLKISHIDSLVSVNERKVSTVYQKIERNTIERMHSRNPDNISNVYRFTDDKILISTTFSAYSVGDTDMIVTLYFSEDDLIKAKTVSFDLQSNKTEHYYYYEDNKLINKETEMSGIHGASFYVDRAVRLRRNLKKRPFKFPL